MFVLMDIEWVTNKQYQFAPTQIAAMRVENSWLEQDVFFERVRPKDTAFHLWDEVAYSGGEPSDFLYARGIYQVLLELQDWLQEDDVLCFWTKDSISILKSIYMLVLRKRVPQKTIDLSEYIFPYLKERNRKCGNAYQLAFACGVSALGPKHHSEQDVRAMSIALAGIRYPAQLLLQAPPKPAVKAPAEKPKATPSPDHSFPVLSWR